MQNTIVHYEGAASLEAVTTKVKPAGAVIKIGLDVRRDAGNAALLKNCRLAI